jgi:hypothetical protein
MTYPKETFAERLVTYSLERDGKLVLIEGVLTRASPRAAFCTATAEKI